MSEPIEPCLWYRDKLARDGKITSEEAVEHRKVCSACLEVDRRALRHVDHEIPLREGWRRAKCPWCFVEVKVPEQGEHGYHYETCECGAVYTVDVFCESSDEVPSLASYLLGCEEYELPCALETVVDVYIYHNYDPHVNAFNDLLAPMYDIGAMGDDDVCLTHFVFVCRKAE